MLIFSIPIHWDLSNNLTITVSFYITLFWFYSPITYMSLFNEYEDKKAYYLSFLSNFIFPLNANPC